MKTFAIYRGQDVTNLQTGVARGSASYLKRQEPVTEFDREVGEFDSADVISVFEVTGEIEWVPSEAGLRLLLDSFAYTALEVWNKMRSEQPIERIRRVFPQ